jgi:hypothetical protein
MIRISPTIQKTLMPLGPLVIAITQGAAKQVLPPLRGDSTTNPVTPAEPREVASRKIFNDANGKLVYVCLGGTADSAGSWHLQLAAGQQLDCSDHAGSVSVFCPTGTTNIAVTVILNEDIGQFRTSAPAPTLS